MNSDQWLKLFGIIVSLVGICAWPLIAGLVLRYFGPSLKLFLSKAEDISVKAGPSGIEVSAKKQIEAAALLGAATAQKQAQADSAGQIATPESANSIARAVVETITPSVAQHVVGAHVLWVDDRPSNNIYERAALEALGIRVTISPSTEDALRKMRMTRYAAIISDMGRPSDQQAGYTLLVLQRRITRQGVQAHVHVACTGVA